MVQPIGQANDGVYHCYGQQYCKDDESSEVAKLVVKDLAGKWTKAEAKPSRCTQVSKPHLLVGTVLLENNSEAYDL